MAKRRLRTINGVYHNGEIRFHTTLKLGRKLPLPNRTALRFRIEVPETAHALRSFGLLRVPKRLARLIAESPEFSVLNS